MGRQYAPNPYFAPNWMMNSRLRNHLLFWMAYVGFKTLLNVPMEGALEWSVYSAPLLSQLSFLLVKVPLVYVFFYLSDRYLSHKGSRPYLAIALAGCMVAGVLGMAIVNHKIVLPMIWHHDTVSPVFGLASLVYHFFTLAFVVGVALAIRLARSQQHMNLRQAELEKEKKEAELKYLKGQIHPHFLFNTLNNIYALARKGSGQTPDAVMKLASLMRFMLYEASSTTILLEDELRIIADYIELEKLRYTDRLQVTFHTEVDRPGQRIAPLLLIHFVENAFKHGAGESRAAVDIRISVVLAAGVLTAEISNPLGTARVPEESAHIGLENTRRQLNLLYPGHTLSLAQENDRFHVRLTIPLPETV